MKKILTISLLLTLSLFAGSEKAAVYDLSTGDIAKFKQMILKGIAKTKGYYEGKLETLNVAVVIHGNAYKFFVKDLSASPYTIDKALAKEQEDIKKRLFSLANYYHVHFEVCGVGIKHRKIKPENLYSFVKIAENTVTGLIDWQTKGYAYIPAK